MQIYLSTPPLLHNSAGKGRTARNVWVRACLRRRASSGAASGKNVWSGEKSHSLSYSAAVLEASTLWSTSFSALLRYLSAQDSIWKTVSVHPDLGIGERRNALQCTATPTESRQFRLTPPTKNDAVLARALDGKTCEKKLWKE